MADWTEHSTDEQRRPTERMGAIDGMITDEQRDEMTEQEIVETEASETADGSLNATGAYETQDGVVLYDTENPLAWIQADNAVALTEIS